MRALRCAAALPVSDVAASTGVDWLKLRDHLHALKPRGACAAAAAAVVAGGETQQILDATQRILDALDRPGAALVRLAATQPFLLLLMVVPSTVPRDWWCPQRCAERCCASLCAAGSLQASRGLTPQTGLPASL